MYLGPRRTVSAVDLSCWIRLGLAHLAGEGADVEARGMQMRAAKSGTALRLAKHSIWKGDFFLPLLVSAPSFKGFVTWARVQSQQRLTFYSPDSRKPFDENVFLTLWWSCLGCVSIRSFSPQEDRSGKSLHAAKQA